MRALFSTLLISLTLLAGCKSDEGPEQVKEARAQYEQLVLQGKLPNDPAFGEVLKKLDAVPSDSKAHAEAARLRGAILTARGPRVSRPLAAVEKRDDPEIQAKQDECAKHAIELGKTPPAGRDAKKKQLEQCRLDLEKLLAHGHDEPSGGSDPELR